MDPQPPGRGRGSACPACRFRSFPQDCIFALYFSDPAVYDNVHRLFGHSTTAKLFQHIEPDHHEDLAKSISWEALMWRRSPPGCLACIYSLLGQIAQQSGELAASRSMLEVLRRQQQQAPPNYNSPPHGDAGGNGNDHHNMHASSSARPEPTSVKEDRNIDLNQTPENDRNIDLNHSPENSDGSGGGC